MHHSWIRAAAGLRQWQPDGLAHLLARQAVAALHTTTSLLALTEQQHEQPVQQQQPAPPPPPPAAAAAAATARWVSTPRPSSPGAASSSSSSSSSSSTALAVQRPPDSFVQRAIATALDAINRVVMLLGSMRVQSANERYVQRYLERRLGMDSFTLQYLQVVRPGIFRLSVSKQIEPVVSWLRSQGIQGEALAEFVRHTPAVLSASVDEQLEPLADLVRWAGGSPRDVLAAYPGIAVVPVAHLRGTRHVLRQLGVTDEEFALLLVSLPDMASQLADTLHRLFQDFGVAAWKLAARQQRQLAGMVHHHMMHWNRGGRPAGSTATVAGGGHPDSGDEGEGGGRGGAAHARHASSAHLQGHTHRPGQGVLSTSYLLDREAFRRLKRVQSALDALAMQEESEEDWAAAVDELGHAVHALGELSRAADQDVA